MSDNQKKYVGWDALRAFLDSCKNIFATKTQLDTIIDAKADWNQNDENSIDYIKNRTHYAEPKLETVMPETNNDIYQEIETNNNMSLDSTQVVNKIVLDKAYIVTVDGVKYRCIAYESIDSYYDSYNTLGDSRLTMALDTEGNEVSNTSHPEDVPFCIQYRLEDDGAIGLTWFHNYYFNYPDSETHTIKIEVETDEVAYHTLDENFIPDTIARTLYLDENFALKSEIPDIDVDSFETKENAQLKYDELNSVKKDKDIIVTYQEGSTFGVTHSSAEIFDAINNGQTVKFKKDTELLDVLEATVDYITFYMFYVNMEGKLHQRIVVVSDNSVMLDQDETYDYATKNEVNAKADKTHTHTEYETVENASLKYDEFSEDIASKQDTLIGTEGQIVQFDTEGKPVASDLELITIDDIDAICGSSIEAVNLNDEVF